MPFGFLTEDGPRHDLNGAFGDVELPTADHPARTRRNAAESDAYHQGQAFFRTRCHCGSSAENLDTFFRIFRFLHKRRIPGRDLDLLR